MINDRAARFLWDEFVTEIARKLRKLQVNYFIVKMSALVSTTTKHVNMCPSCFFFGQIAHLIRTSG